MAHRPRRPVRAVAHRPGALTLRGLLPESAQVPVEEAYADLGLLARAHADRPFVAANMITTADGRATLNGRTEGISSGADRALFHALRAQVDAVMVGTGTIAIERYGRLARRPEVIEHRTALGLSPQPVCVTASRSMELPGDAPLFQDPESHVIVLTNSDRDPPPVRCRLTVERLLGEDLDLGAAMSVLRRRHEIRAILMEGGPTLLAAMLDSGLVDELFLSVSPLLVGGGEPSVVEGTALPSPQPLQLSSVLEHESFLYLRYRLGI